MSNNSQRDGVNARIARKIAGCEFRQFTVVAFRQILPNFAQLFFNNVKIVNQPFSRRRDGLFIANRIGQRTVCGDENTSVFFKTRKQFAKPFRLGDIFLLGGENRRKLLKSLDAEKFGANRLVITFTE